MKTRPVLLARICPVLKTTRHVRRIFLKSKGESVQSIVPQTKLLRPASRRPEQPKQTGIGMKIAHGEFQERLPPSRQSVRCPMGLFLRLTISLMLFVGAAVQAQELRVTESLVNAQGRFTVFYASDASAYYVLYAGDRVTELTRVAALTLGANGEGQLVDPLSIGGN